VEVKKLWVNLGLRDPAFPLQEMACYGCKRENKCAYPELRVCANQMAIVLVQRELEKPRFGISYIFES
jgi:hypothetical protein